METQAQHPLIFMVPNKQNLLVLDGSSLGNDVSCQSWSCLDFTSLQELYMKDLNFH
jgi:hypothetical protein